MKAGIPVQYTSLDGVHMRAIMDFTNRSSTLSGHVGSPSSAIYRQVGIGKGRRSDFTKDNIDDKGDFNYDYDRMRTIRDSLE